MIRLKRGTAIALEVVLTTDVNPTLDRQEVEHMSNPTTLYVNMDWPNPSKTAPIFVQATAAAGLQQQVTVSCKALNFSQTATSDTSLPFGTQYLNALIDGVPTSEQPYVFEVTVSYYQNSQWNLSAIVTAENVQLNNYGYMAMALANDSGNDEDYNDTVVMISTFNQSND